MAEPTLYELQRAQRVEQNRRKMQEMGLLAASREFAAAAAAAPQGVALAAGQEVHPRLKRRRAQPAEPGPLEPTRLSRRLRGETAPSQDEAAAAARAEAEAEGRARARMGGTRKQLRMEEGQQLAPPFSLWSIGVTIWELGHVHRGAWANRYWSSPGCLYHHAYPVGYRATKVQFGRTYDMQIEEGPTGPVFKVIDQQTGTVFSGTSPTKPWTDVCIAHRTGQRISGPLFFGFSDLLTQRAIAANLYNDQELRAALQGEKVEVSTVSPEEEAARQLCTVDGVGEATAIILARSTALGGSRHSGLESLKSWAGASDANARHLFDYLTTSAELPESTLRWPAWRQRLAPKIVLALSGRWLGEGAAPQQGTAGAGEAGPEAAAEAAAEAEAAAVAPQEAPAAGAGEPGPAAATEAAAEAEAAVAAPQEAPAADVVGEVKPVGRAGGEAAAAAAGAAGGCSTRGPDTDASHQLAMDQPQQQPEQAAAHLQTSAAAAAAGVGPSKAKENKQTQNSGARCTAAAAAKGAPGGAQPKQRSSQRQRKASTKLAEYDVTADGAEDGEEEV